MKRFYTVINLIFACSVCCCAYSQNLTYYKSPEDDAGKLKEWTDATEKRYRQDVSGISGKNKKYIEQFYTDRYQNIKKIYDQKEILTNTEATGYLQSLFNEVAKSNPAI